MISGIINVLKPCGMTSHDVVGYVRRVLHTKKVGHAGTLDPDAAGVLPVFVGNATRLIEYAAEDFKHYRAKLTFGIKTDTGDDSGNVIATSNVKITKELLRETLKKFMGEQKQVPPMYSALKVNGQPLYKLARQGIEIERTARDILIYDIHLVAFSEDSCVIDVRCSKGTYIRTLLEDICEAMNTCGTMSFLLRLSAANLGIDSAVTLEEIAEEPEKYLQNEETVVAHLPVLVLTAKQAWRITQGVKTTVTGTKDGMYRLKDEQGNFLGIAEAEAETVKAKKILMQAPKPEMPEG